ncbi:hypothetical protein Ahy_A04g018782 [Arachis hypogaea]|uniref:Uncharacterized protein n=1 Tax=Arachis hypogaea TaxID=3818 RepID=A0A445DEI4_ARAHY|nr:hypothetical protein Ahy_A04g018782 [Arachis hypogaea]
MVGQDLWEKTGSSAPVLPPIKLKPGRPTTNRRKDKDEGSTGTKTKMKRKYAPIRCMYCGELAAVQPPQPAPGLEVEKENYTQPIQTLPAVAAATPDEQTEIPVTQHAQLPLTQQSHTSTNVTQTKGRGRSPKLHVTRARAKENASPGAVTVSAKTIKGSSSATAKKLVSFMTFVPTPDFLITVFSPQKQTWSEFFLRHRSEELEPWLPCDCDTCRLRPPPTLPIVQLVKNFLSLQNQSQAVPTMAFKTKKGLGFTDLGLI